MGKNAVQNKTFSDKKNYELRKILICNKTKTRLIKNNDLRT